jgi:phosphotransferase system HPr-like phosphotransfer protein
MVPGDFSRPGGKRRAFYGVLDMGLRSNKIWSLLGIARDVTVRITLTDPHGLHMRRCKDLVQIARKYLAYQIYLRNPAGRSPSWANAKSLLSLQALGVRGSVPGEPPAVVEVRIQGFRPGKPLREIKRVLQAEPQKYLSVYELTALAEAVGGEVVIKPRAEPEKKLRRRLIHRLRSIGSRLFHRAAPSVAEDTAPRSKTPD